MSIRIARCNLKEDVQLYGSSFIQDAFLTPSGAHPMCIQKNKIKETK
jgi:hypothetical protein